MRNTKAAGHRPASITRRSMIKLGAAAAAGLAAPSLVNAQGLVEVGSIRSVPVAWTFGFEDFASAMNFFQDEGLRLDPRLTGKAPNNDVLLSGGGTILISPPDQVLRAQMQGMSIKMIAGGVNKFASSIIAKKSIMDQRGVTEASSLEDKVKSMKGLRFGTTGSGAAPDSLFRYLIIGGGMDPERDCELVPLRGGGAAMLAAFKQGQIDGFCLSSPTPEIGIKDFGGAYLFNMCANPPPFFSDFLYLSASVLDKTVKDQPDVLVKYCRAIARSLRTINQDPDRFKKWAEGFFKGFPPGMFEVSFPDNSKVFPQTPVCSRHHFDSALEFIAKSSTADQQVKVPANFKYETSINNSFVEKALATLPG